MSNIQENIKIRPANINDAHIIFEWVNEPLVRANSLNTEPILWENHIKWFQKKLNDVNTRIFILELNETPLAQVRFDRQEDDAWLIDFSVSINHRGKGYGKTVLSKGMEVQGDVTFLAYVKSQNQASLNTFRKLGFVEIPSPDENIVAFKKN